MKVNTVCLTTLLTSDASFKSNDLDLMLRAVTVKFERSDHSLHEIWHGEKSTKIPEQPNGNSAVLQRMRQPFKHDAFSGITMNNRLPRTYIRCQLRVLHSHIRSFRRSNWKQPVGWESYNIQLHITGRRSNRIDQCQWASKSAYGLHKSCTQGGYSCNTVA